MRATGHLPGVVRFAGRQVERDVWTAAPPLAAPARLSQLFRWLPKDGRGTVAATALTAVAVALAAVLLLT